MKRALLVVSLCMSLPFLIAAQPKGETKQTEGSTLTGVIHRHGKPITPAYLKIDGGGRLNLSGTRLGKIEDGTRVLVRGAIKTKLHAPPRGTSPLPTQWIVSMWVDHVEVIDKPFGDLIKTQKKSEEGE